MRPVTAGAILRELPVLRARFFDMTRGTRARRCTSAVRLVTIHALCVARRSAVSLRLVTTLAGRGLCSAMRLVAARAFLVALPGPMLLVRMASLAACQQRRGPVRESAMTARAILVTAARRDSRQLLRVTAAAQGALGLGERESVRLVALGAADAAVKLIVRVGGLVAAAAAAGRFAEMATRRMRVVATDTGAHLQLRVIRMHRRMAVGTSLRRSPAHVMGRVAARALVVGRDARRCQRHDLGVARTARASFVLSELVRSMATHAFAVSAGK
jgi:hypothetical protein